MELILIAFFLSLSILTETIGVWSRVLGAFNNEPTVGYSTHVRIATLGRFFILISAPTLGYFIDSGAQHNYIALIGCFAFLFILLSIVIFLKFGFGIFSKLYGLINNKSGVLEIDNNLICGVTIDKVFFIYVFISFVLTGTGVIIVNYVAAIYPDMRAMIVQMAAVITMFGTLLHVFLIDPKLSRAADQDKQLLVKLTVSFLYSRALSSALLMILFFVLYLI